MGLQGGRSRTCRFRGRLRRRLGLPRPAVCCSRHSTSHLSNIGLSHFFAKEEFAALLKGFAEVDPCLSEYYLPREEARRRGYDEYLQSMWTVYAVK